MSSISTRVWIAVVAVLVFVSGVSIGVAMSAWRVARFSVAAPGYTLGEPPTERVGRPPFRLPGRAAGDFRATDMLIERLARDPDFTDDQRAKLQALFEARRERFEQFNRDMRDRFIAERESLRNEVAAILTPAQLDIFDAMQRPRRWRGPGGERNQPTR